MWSWGIELNSGETRQIPISEEVVLHISQATLDIKKRPLDEPASVRMEVGGKLFALIALNPKKFPQQFCDLILERTFTVSNNWENGSVVLSGYLTNQPAGNDEFLHGDIVDEDEKDEPATPRELKKLIEKKLDAKQIRDANEKEVTRKDSDFGQGSNSMADVTQLMMASSSRSCKMAPLKHGAMQSHNTSIGN